MAVFKCKMCGGTIEFEDGATVGVCDSCGTRQTLPSPKDEIISNLHNRANSLRLKCEFDKAEDVYNKILEKEPEDAEAHWGIILCKYGIEYVEDPKSDKRIPTCHRTSYDAVLGDEDYKAAMLYGDGEQRHIYEKEAKEIDRIQKDILTVVEKEKPFDVFICYKETDSDGKRTQDSVIANDIYYQLTREGFKVFYAAITLEDKLGKEYEPYIFAALNSSKVMLVVGSKPEYFNAVWVKNEWSRFLKLMKTDRNRLLIPCYRDMDAYDLPEEFMRLQAQDMSKIGFINDLVRGIKKVAATEESSASEPVKKKADVYTSANPTINSLFQRAEVFLEDGNWDQANSYADRILDIEPKNPDAYLLKLLARKQVVSVDRLATLSAPFTDDPDYLHFKRFASPDKCEKVDKYIEEIKQRYYKTTYDSAIKEMGEDTVSGYENAVKNFEQILKYKDSEEKRNYCAKRIGELKANIESEEKKRIENEKILKRRTIRNVGIALVVISLILIILTLSTGGGIF
ncbi:MAG: TIR domain-containing protein [Clostridia bacterium]|nr:TIR domain-containing protein [Clostridia bacterium]